MDGWPLQIIIHTNTTYIWWIKIFQDLRMMTLMQSEKNIILHHEGNRFLASSMNF